MKFTKKITGHYKDIWESDIDNLLIVFEKHLVPFYNSYGIEITELEFVSAKDFDMETKINIKLKEINSVYPSLTFYFSRLGRGFKSPSQRDFECLINIKNTTPEIEDFIYQSHKKYKIFKMYSVQNVDDPEVKIKHLLNNVKESVDMYIGLIKMSNLFLF